MRVFAALPVEPDELKTIIVVVVGGFVLLSLLVARFITKMVIKLAMIALLLGAAGLVWSQRADLDDCARECECTFLGIDVRLPDDAAAICDRT